MKKVIPILIVLFVFGFVTTSGFLILKVAISSDTSNAKLIEAFMDKPSPSSTPIMTFMHLADAESVMGARPATRISTSAGYFADMTPAPAPVPVAQNTSSTDQSDGQALATTQGISAQ